MDPAALLRKSARIYPDNVAVVCGDRRQSYAELLERASRLANALRDARVEPGDRVALLGDNAFETLEQVAGLALGGYVRCPLYTHDVPERHEYLLGLTGATALIVEEKYYAAIAPMLERMGSVRVTVVVGTAPEGTLDYEELLGAAAPEPPGVALRDDDPHVIRFSAGTTGLPKGILHTVRGWTDMGNEMALVLGGFHEDDCYLAAGPLSHAAGMISWPLLAVGASTVVMPAFDAADFLELVERERVTTTIVGPTVIQMVTNHPDAATRDLSSLRIVGYGTAPATETTLRKAIEVWGNIMYQVYGQSEALPLTILGPRHHVVDGPEHERRRLRSAGRPTPNSDVRILDDDGNELPVGEVGEVAGSTPGRMREIWGAPEATAQRMTPDGWVRTRDMGWLSDDGFLYLADRKEDTIISGGYNIWPIELENALAAHPAVAEAAVVGVSHPKWGETPHAVVVLADGARATEDELIQWTREKVGSVRKVTGVSFADELPKTPIGKVLRRVVREQYASAAARQARA
ncbi:class I adenylate-forming enzyme family protein [Qaidamihabitans albus]|uniref:class I adenylate-forming enzyme family protein n=1 Tax=Qaidamihabitans albus TaxID=2795733 RepID=UPI0018F259E6|nr:AMP-binding protein [Qaidamihabitans albus]